MNRHYDIEQIPFLKILPFVIVGIVVANLATIPRWIVLVGIVISCACALLYIKNLAGSMATAVSIVLCTMLTTDLTATRSSLPIGEKVKCVLRLESNGSVKGRWQQFDAMVESYCRQQGQWVKNGEKITVRIDTATEVSAGDRVLSSTYINPISSNPDSGYARLMWRRGHTASCYLTSPQSTLLLPDKAHDIRIASAKAQAYLTSKLSRLQLDHKTEALCRAMTFGDRSMLDSAHREEYAISGAAHILAVSGLHVGIVAMLVNILLFALPFIRGGHIIRNVAAIIMILAYAFTTGMSPSVVRAALMFCGLQIAFATSSRHNKINILLATATLMLIVNPNYLYDISFQLSFIAVTGLTLFYGPAYGYFRCGRRIIDWFNGITLVSIIATLCTAPLVAAQFGRVSVAGVVINPIIIITATLVVIATMLYAIFPIGLLSAPVGWLLNSVAGFQNSLIEYCSTLSWATFDVKIDMWGAVCIYLAMAIITHVIRIRVKQKSSKLNISR